MTRRVPTSDLEAALRPGGIRAVYQPIFELTTGHVVGYEALARFDQEPSRSPDRWFSAARGAKMLHGLELAAIAAQIAGLANLSADSYLGFNVSPATACSPELAELLAPLPPERLVLEITARTAAADYRSLDQDLRPLRDKGVRLALDDVGSDPPDLAQILALAPDMIKLDVDLTRGIDADKVRRSIASALVAFARPMGLVVIAEGIETAAEFTTLLDLGVGYGQGFFLARPSASGDRLLHHEPAGDQARGTERIRVAIVDDHAVVAQALASLLGAEPELVVSGVALDLGQAVELLDRGETDVVVCDIQLGDESGFSLLRRYEGRATPRFVMYTAYDHPMYHRAAFEAGASAFVLKMEQPGALVGAVMAAAAGQSNFSPATMRAVRSQDEIPTARELAVLERLADGQSTAEVAAALGIAPRTVESHLRALFDRAGAMSRTELVLHAIRQGWIRPRATSAAGAGDGGRTGSWLVDADLLKAANSDGDASKRPVRRGIR